MYSRESDKNNNANPEVDQYPYIVPVITCNPAELVTEVGVWADSSGKMYKRVMPQDFSEKGILLEVNTEAGPFDDTEGLTIQGPVKGKFLLHWVIDLLEMLS